jgi:hypothetical protein
VVVSIFLRPFFSHFGNKKKSRALSSKGFLWKNNVPKALDFFQDLFIYLFFWNSHI